MLLRQWKIKGETKMKKILVTLALMFISTNAYANAERVRVPSDSKATYHMVVKNINGAKAVITQRKGPSGTSFAIREVNCGNKTFRYMGEGRTLNDALENMRLHGDKNMRMSRVTYQSISYYIVKAACK